MKFLKTLFTTLALGFFLIPTVQSATLTVCASGCDHTSIKDAIAAASAGDVISIKSGTYTEAAIIVDKDLTFQGQGQVNTIVQAHASPEMAEDQVFIVNLGLTVIFRDLTIRHGHPQFSGLYLSNRGGGVFISSSADTDVSFTRVTITKNHALPFGSGGGVAISGSLGTVKFTDCEISENESRTSGGGISNTGTGHFEMTRCSISGNSSGNGGGIYSWASTNFVLNDCGISENTSTSSGAGIYLREAGPVTSFTDCIFHHNIADGNAGGLHVSFTGPMDFVDCMFTENEGSQGGGIYFQGHAGTIGDVSMTGSTLSDNKATSDGGGIYFTSKNDLNMTDCTVSDNHANTQGGGLFISLNGSVAKLSECIVHHNIAGEPSLSRAGLGGGITVSGTNTSTTDRFEIENSVISDNEVTGAGILGHYGRGGGIYNWGVNYFSMNKSTVSGNKADGQGGGIAISPFMRYPINKFINSTIHNNVAGGAAGGGVLGNSEGGGLFLGTATSYSLINCTVVNNEVIGPATSRSGGGIFFTDSELKLTNTIVANNSGASSGANGDDIFQYATSTMSIISSLVEDCDNCSAAPTYTSDPNLAPVALCGDQSYFAPQSGSDALNNGTGPGGEIPNGDICDNFRCDDIDIGAYEVSTAGASGGYTSMDIGDVSGQVGNTIIGPPGTYTVTTSGKGIKGTADGFHFDAYGHSGDIELIVRVTGIQNNSSRQAGLMLRSHLGAGAPNVALLINGKKQIKLTKRSSEGGVTTTLKTKSARSRLNSWLRLTKTGSTVIAYYSRSGTIWEIIGITSFDSPCGYEAGLATSKGASGSTKVFTYDNFTIDGVSPTPPPPRFAASQELELSLTAFPNPFGDQLSYRLEGVEVGTQYHVSLLDLTGRAVIAFVETLDSNVSTKAINTAEIAAGIYFLEIRTPDERKLVKVVKR